jgi:hypothetical protein
MLFNYLVKFKMFSCLVKLIYCLHVLVIIREIASGTVPDPGSLKASDKTLLNVLVKVPHSILVSLAKDIGADWDIDYQLDISLIIDLPVIGNFTIPLCQKGEIKLPTISDMFA